MYVCMYCTEEQQNGFNKDIDLAEPYRWFVLRIHIFHMNSICLTCTMHALMQCRGAAQLLNFTCQNRSTLEGVQSTQFFNRLPHRQQREEALQRDVRMHSLLFVMYVCTVYVCMYVCMYVCNLFGNYLSTYMYVGCR